jgi:localization factor PodJL
VTGAGFEPDERMNSRASWNVEGIDPAVRERAESAARRAGLSLSDWLNSTLGESAPRDLSRTHEPRPVPGRESHDLSDIHQRLDSITRQIDQISRTAPPRQESARSEPARGEPGVARQLNDALSRLDARLSQISSPEAAKKTLPQSLQPQPDPVERGATEGYRPSAAPSPSPLELAVAEITARQSELDKTPPRQTPPRNVPARASATATAAAGPDLASLERHLFKITSQIEALQPPGAIEPSIAAFRAELAEIRTAITEAMPRRAIESIENEVRSLSRRIDGTRQSGIDAQALAGIERALDQIREALRSLKPAEQLAGYEEAIGNLNARLDTIIRAGDDPSTVHQLENAIAALRSIVSNVASTDALARLSEDVQTLSSKVDQLARAGDHRDGFAALEQRIATLTSSLQNRERPQGGESTEQIEGALRGLSDRIDRIPAATDGAAAFAHLEQRVSYLLERLESSADHRNGNLGRVEDGLQDILRHLEAQHANLAALTDRSGHVNAPEDSGLAEIVKRELSDIRLSQTERDRQTQISLEAVHNSLGHVTDRLAMIEGDLRDVRSAAIPPQVKPELPNPAATETHFSAAPRDFHAASAGVAGTPRAISDILETPAPSHTAPETDLPPDHPLEPGTRPTGRPGSPLERIAASESAISEIAASSREQASATNFIAAARRAAQAAAASPPADKVYRGPIKPAAINKAAASSTITSKIRSLLVGASVVVIVLGSFKMAMTFLDGSGAPQLPAMENARTAPAPAHVPADDEASPPAPAPTAPSMASPAPDGRQSLDRSAPAGTDGSTSVPIPQPAAAPAGRTASDATGAIPVAPAPADGKLPSMQIPPSDILPDAIGGPLLRSAALKGDPAAAYEVGVRFAEGKGVAPNLEEAAKWYDRAAEAGIVPAVFRLGTLYEKGLGVKKDIDSARRYYMQAAERGNAKAMHNLAVLDADGGGKGANYRSAAQWFRKAAERGVADSQFNLGILYARGIGVEQNLAESYKWFSLAAAQGDADSGRKRDDIAKRLDAQSLAAAKLAIQTFTIEPQPNDAVNAPVPAGGWDAALPQASNARTPAKPTAFKRAAR